MAVALTSIAKTVLEARYLLRDNQNNITETYDELFERVAKAIANVEEESQREYWEKRFLSRLMNLDFLPNTPTLMNAGKPGLSLSACYVLPMEDSIEGIFSTLKLAVDIWRSGGGTGYDFSSLRPEGSIVSNKAGVSTGPLSFCQIFDKAADVIKQGGSRRAAQMMTFRVDHPDILEFITMKLKKGVMENFNVSVCITNEFMEALKVDGEYWLHHPFTGPTKKLKASYVWNLIAESAWASAEPGILFVDRANELSSFNETLVATNPCGEQWLPAYGVCNLGSINLSNFVLEDQFNWDELEECVVDGTRFLDNVIDANYHPHPEIEKKTKHYRNIGLGVMGWADALIKLGIPYNSEHAIKLGNKVQGFIERAAHEYSVYLGKEKGYPEGVPFKSIYDETQKWYLTSPLRRNATLTTVVPTGTTSMIAGCCSGIEPVFAFQMKRYQLDQEFTDLHPLWEKHLESGNTYNREAFVEASDVSWEDHVRMQAAFQNNVDNSISKTINMASSATVSDVKEAYMLAWQTGCKGITVYRDGSRGQGVLEHISKDDECCESPQILISEGCETCQSCGNSKCSIA